jgi:hypothetical protein
MTISTLGRDRPKASCTIQNDVSRLVRHDQSQDPSILQDAVNILQPAHKVRHVLDHVAGDHEIELPVFICFGQADLRKIEVNRAYVLGWNVGISCVFEMQLFRGAMIGVKNPSTRFWKQWSI